MYTEPETSSSSDEDFHQSRRYEILIDRLQRFLKKNPQLVEDEDKDDDNATEWCHCRQGDLGTISVRCDAPGCSIRWYHKECLPYQDQRLVDEFDLWICPSCLMNQLADLVKEQRPVTRTSDKGDEVDEVVGQEINMAEVDARLRRTGNWVFNDSTKNTPGRWRSKKSKIQSDAQPLHSHHETDPSLIAAKTASAIIPHPSLDESLPGTWGASLSVMAKLTISVSDFSGVQRSARIWTSDATQVSVTAEKQLSVAYMHDYCIPRQAILIHLPLAPVYHSQTTRISVRIKA